MNYRQYSAIKAQHPDSILLFRIGEFYETFDEDAKTLATVCNVSWTAMILDGQTVQMVGIPHVSLEIYVEMLIEAGYTVAVVDQANDAGGKIVQRAVY